MKYLGAEINISIGKFEEARAAGRRSARSQVPYSENPYGKYFSAKDQHWAWSLGHNEQRAAILNKN